MKKIITIIILLTLCNFLLNTTYTKGSYTYNEVKSLVFTTKDLNILEDKIDRYLNEKHVIDIKINSVRHSYIHYICLIIYVDK
jgi:hypothetical protein